jgi:hypothetical protein
MSYLPSFLRSAALVSGGTATLASVATVTTLTVMTTGQAEAKSRPKSQRGFGSTTVITATANAR